MSVRVARKQSRNPRRMFAFPQHLYAITDTGISGLSHVEQVERLLMGGARFIQLREKNLSPREFFPQAEKVLALAHAAGARIIINDRPDIAVALNADGVHLGQDDLPAAAARGLLGDGAIIGVSTHSFEQAVKASSEPVDYLAVGPIFSTRTKTNPEPVVGLEQLARIRSVLPQMPLVGIGGITLENAISVLEAGADSAAIIRALLEVPGKIP